MRKIFFSAMVFFSLLVAMSCGEDRTYEYEEKTQHNQWMYDVMVDKYLWADTLSAYEPTWKNFFATPAEFLSTLASKTGHTDSWSYVEVDTVSSDSHERGNFNHINSYGYDFTLMTDPTGQTTKSVLRVLTVYGGSPADRAGLMRGDFIRSFDSYKISSSNMARLQKGVARSLEVCHLGVDELEGEFYWEDTVSVSLPASEYVEDDAFPVYQVINVNDTLVGYLMCNRLLAYPVEQGEGRTSSTVYQDELDQIMAQLKGVGVTELVLDLRLCNFGTLDMAGRLASYVVAPQYLGTSFAKTFHNEKYASEDTDLLYDSSLGNLGLSRVYILTSSYTQGAAEWLIHGLQTTMGEENVILVGQSTNGQYVMTEEVGHEYYVRLFPVVAYVADGNGDYDYGSLSPTLNINEFDYVSLADYGSPSEILLYTAIQHIRGLISQNDSEDEENSDETADDESGEEEETDESAEEETVE